MSKPPTQKRRVIYVDDDTWAKIKRIAKYRKVSMSEVIRQLLEEL